MTLADRPATARMLALDDPSPGTGTLAPRSRLQTDAATRSLDGSWRFRLSNSIAAAPRDPPPTDDSRGDRTLEPARLRER